MLLTGAVLGALLVTVVVRRIRALVVTFALLCALVGVFWAQARA